MAEVPKIQDYAIIGNGRSAALISKNGSLDWLCWPRFDSASIFGALIDPKIGGRWSICPASDSQMMRRYIENTNVLETTFSNGSGKIVLTDFMPVTSEEEKKGRLWPENELIRLIRCEAGEVPVLIDFDPRPNYGRTTSFIKDAGKLGWRVGVGTALLTLRSNIDTINWWQHWAARARYDGPYRKQVIRSALLLALLSYAPSGALVAAPSTSLPERIGGDLNWDYRFCWLRDAALAVRALFALGYNEDAEAFVSWLLHTTRLTRPCLHTLYDVYGNIIPRERTLPHLSGYNSSRPVRLGNAASEQLQLDVYGEVIEAVSHFCCDEAKIDRETQNMLRRYGDYVCRHWYEPDNGMWESRRTPQHNTHSRLLCWVALDRLIALQGCGRLKGLPIERLMQTRERIRSEIEQRGWNPKLQAYTQVLGGDSLDANVLLLALYGFEDATSERMRKTHQQLREKLSPKVGLMYRNARRETKGEGAMTICSFLEANFLARSGNLEEASRVFQTVLGYANDVDLFAEEIDPETGDALGNFPQALTHLALINAALSLRNTT